MNIKYFYFFFIKDIDPELLLYHILKKLNVDKIVKEALREPKEINDKQLLTKSSQIKEKGTIPTTFLILTFKQKKLNKKLLRCLFDAGGSHTNINKRSLPEGIKVTKINDAINATTAAGPFKMDEEVLLKNVILPEFSKSFKIDSFSATIFNSPGSQYDIILGRDMLKQMKLDVSYTNHTVTWLNHTIDMKTDNFHYSHLNLFRTFIQQEDILLEESFLKEILPSKYGKVEIDDVIQ